MTALHRGGFAGGRVGPRDPTDLFSYVRPRTPAQSDAERVYLLSGEDWNGPRHRRETPWRRFARELRELARGGDRACSFSR